MDELIVEILPNLWLSGYKYACKKSFLEEKGIRLIINCSTNIEFAKDIPNIKKIRIPVNDSLQENDIDLLTIYLPKTTLILAKYFKNMEPVIVHCYAGKQRSATVIAAFLMSITKLEPRTIIALIQSKKRNAFRPCINFSKSLNEYYKTII